ncbi:hypothetical protein DFJ73DRAFT_792430 [Zopfochytrium polystomum]|nr:hypothetical protein DFJ73DRAFT_792430 [Zopfochytrium polystomum]
MDPHETRLFFIDNNNDDNDEKTTTTSRLSTFSDTTAPPTPPPPPPPPPPPTTPRAPVALGAGPGLAGLTAAYTCGARHAVLTDLAADPGDLRTGRTLATLRAAVVGLSWGDVLLAWPARADGGDPFDFDVLLGSDLIYSSAPVANLVATIAFFLWRPRAEGLPPRWCVLAYHIWSAKRSIQMLLDRWGLEARGIRDDGDVEVGRGTTVLVEGCEEEEVFGVGFGSVVLLEKTAEVPD